MRWRFGQVNLSTLGLLVECELMVQTTCELVQTVVTRGDLATSSELVDSPRANFFFHYTGSGEVLHRDQLEQVCFLS